MSHIQDLWGDIDKRLGLSVKLETPARDRWRHIDRALFSPEPVRKGILIGTDVENGDAVHISLKDLDTHLYAVGATRMGKTKFLETLMKYHVEHGNGFGVIDPHGDLVEDVKGFLSAYIKETKDESILDRVVVIDPTNPTHTVTFNPIENIPGVSTEEQVQELVASFAKIWSDSWGTRLEEILRNSLIALGEANLTLAELTPFLTNPHFRSNVLIHNENPVVQSFFDRFDRQTERARIQSCGPILSKIDNLLSDSRIRQMFSHPTSSFNLRDIIDSGKILLVKLEQGKLVSSGELIGSLLMSKIKIAAFSRTDIPQHERKMWHLYIDEFQNFASHTFNKVLEEAGKYALSFIMAHQHFGQIPIELRNSLLGNPVMQVYFRPTNRSDAAALAKEAFRYHGHSVKRERPLQSGDVSYTYWGLGEEWELNTARLQDLPPRHCYVKNLKTGELKYVKTADIESPWQSLGIDQPEYLDYLRQIPFGSNFLIERSKIEAERQERSTKLSDAPSQVPTQTPTIDRNSSPAQEFPQEGQIISATSQESDNLATPLNIENKASNDFPIQKDLIDYLEHVASHPFLPTLLRDETLKLSRYKGSSTRKKLLETGWLQQHKVNTGHRSGQIVLLEVTNTGYEFLSTLGIKAQRPKGRGGFIHRYDAHKIKEYSETIWPGCIAKIEGQIEDRPSDVLVRIPTSDPNKTERTVAFEVFVTGEDKEIKGLAKDIRLFDHIIVCAITQGQLESLKKNATNQLGNDILDEVTFSLVSQYLIDDKYSITSQHTKPAHNGQNIVSGSNSDTDLMLNITSALGKNPPKSESELERQRRPRNKRERGPKGPLLKQIELAYTHIHDLEWLENSRLSKLPEVRERVDTKQLMPEAQSLRNILLQAAQEVLQDIEGIPDKANVHYFLENHLKGKSVTQIAEELEVTRSWCSSRYRKEAYALAGNQFIKLISRER